MIASFIIHYLDWQAARGFGGTCPKWRLRQLGFPIVDHTPVTPVWVRVLRQPWREHAWYTVSKLTGPSARPRS
jgi:hypothetical protein